MEEKATMELSERKRQILRYVIDAYIRSGEPVGSKALALQMNLSSATIRGEMNELESLGFLTQPHTSAGRVPSDEGYREYVANLMARYRLSVDEIAILDSLLDQRLSEFCEVLEESTRLLSHMTRYAAVSLSAKEETGSVQDLQCIYVNEHSFLLIVIFSDGTTHTHQEHAAHPFSREELSLAAGEARGRFSAKSCREIMDALSAPSGEQLGILPAMIYHALYQVLAGRRRYRVDVAGLSNLLQYPEFSDLDRTREVLSFLEEKERLVRHLTENHHGEISISIGGGKAPTLSDTSMIVRTFRMGDDVVGALGIIGPKRMEYSGTLARLEYLTRRILPENTQKGEDV